MDASKTRTPKTWEEHLGSDSCVLGRAWGEVYRAGSLNPRELP